MTFNTLDILVLILTIWRMFKNSGFARFLRLLDCKIGLFLSLCAVERNFSEMSQLLLPIRNLQPLFYNLDELLIGNLDDDGAARDISLSPLIANKSLLALRQTGEQPNSFWSDRKETLYFWRLTVHGSICIFILYFCIFVFLYFCISALFCRVLLST